MIFDATVSHMTTSPLDWYIIEKYLELYDKDIRDSKFKEKLTNTLDTEPTTERSEKRVAFKVDSLKMVSVPAIKYDDGSVLVTLNCGSGISDVECFLKLGRLYGKHPLKAKRIFTLKVPLNLYETMSRTDGNFVYKLADEPTADHEREEWKSRDNTMMLINELKQVLSELENEEVYMDDDKIEAEANFRDMVNETINKTMTDKEFVKALNELNEEITEDIRSRYVTQSQYTCTSDTPNQSTEGKPSNSGGINNFYKIPTTVGDVDGLSRHLKLTPSQFNILKSLFGMTNARHSGTSTRRDAEKILHYSILNMAEVLDTDCELPSNTTTYEEVLHSLLTKLKESKPEAYSKLMTSL